VRLGDYLLQIDDTDINSEADYYFRIAGHPGTGVAVKPIMSFEKASFQGWSDLYIHA
jgi:hypothetical protein